MYKTLSIFALLFAAAVATHYRYGTMYYVPTGVRTIRLSIDEAWRRSAFGAPNVGDTFAPAVLEYGDGQSVNLNLVVTSINLVDDIVSGSLTVTKTYANNAAYTVQVATCCRISTLRNNADGSLRSFVTMDFANYPNNRSPVSSVLPIVNVPRGSPAFFPITAIDPDGDVLSYRLATVAEYAGASHPTGTSVNGATGLYSWNNQALVTGLYNTAVVISDGKCLMMVDFLMNIVNVQQTNNNPVWQGPTPADQTAFTAIIGNPISFTLECSDQDAGQTINIQSGVLPGGATTSAQSGSNPGSVTFSYSSNVPTTSVVCFSCSDNLLASAGQRCFTLNIQGGCCDLTTTPPTLNGVPTDLNLECGATIPPAPTVTADALCPYGSSPQVVTASETQTGTVCNRVITRTWSFTNTCGRSVTASQTITVRDTTAPFIDSSTAGSRTLQCGSGTTPANTGSISATDNCDNSVTIASSDTTAPSSCLSVASISRRWTATDDCNNQASYTQTLNIVDTTAPTLTVPADVTLECGVDSSAPSSTGSASASDVCDNSVTPTYSDSSVASACLAVGSTERTWTVTDDCGNTASGVQTLTYQDTLKPTTSADDFCVFPPNGGYYCFDTLAATFLHAQDACSTTSHVYNNDCHDQSGSTAGCVMQGNNLCVRAKTDHVSDTTYTFSFTVTDACGNSQSQDVHVTVPNQDNGDECETPNTCISDCPEERCEGANYDLVTEDGEKIGLVFITNKLNYEVDVEVKTFEGAIPDRGWWMLGVNIQIGSKRAVKDWNRRNAQSRWFEAIDVSHAFGNNKPACDGSVDVIVAVLATNDKRNNNGATVRAYPQAQQPNKRSFQLPPNINDYKVPYELCCECTVRGQTQNDWGNICYAPQTPSKRTDDSPRLRAIACYRDDFWNWSHDWCFPNGVVVGCSNGYTATWNTPVAIANGLADQTTARVLTQNWVNPARGSVGYLAGETAALTLNTRLDECDSDFGTSCHLLEDFYVCQHPTSQSRNDCQPFWGQRVSSILAQANQVLGGCASGDVNALFTCVRYINREFVDAKRAWEAPDFSLYPCGGPSK